MSSLHAKRPWFDDEDLDQELICRELEHRADRRQAGRDKIDIIRGWTHHGAELKEVNDYQCENKEASNGESEGLGLVTEAHPDDRQDSKLRIVELKASLKGRELQIVEMMQAGYQQLEIAQALNVTGPRISQILKNIRDRLGDND
jgi:DNA-binding CsgD family transcriptional regulator